MPGVVNASLEVSIAAAVRTRSGGRVELPAVSDPQLVAALLALWQRRGRPPPELDARLLEVFSRAGLVVKRPEAPHAVRFFRGLEAEAPWPRHRPRAPPGPSSALTINPGLRLSGPPPEGAPWPPGLPAPQAWVTDPATRLDWPLWLRRRTSRWLQALQRGAEASAPPGERRAAAACDLLLSPRAAAARRAEWLAQVARARQTARARGWGLLRGVLPPHLVAALRVYVRALDAEGYLHREGRRHMLHEEPLCRFLHHRTLPLIAAVVPEPIKASYCFLTVYQPGAVLERHVDRPQCAWNVSLLLDADPEPKVAAAWPLELHVGPRPIEARLAPGDAVLYRGTTVPHGRPRLGRGRRVALTFFHYVPRDFAGPLT